MRATRHIARDPQVVGLVGQDETGGRVAFQQSSKNRGVGRVAVRHDRGIVVLIALVALIQVCGDLLARSVDHR
jgi:ABC-type methionine transport system permease subunit